MNPLSWMWLKELNIFLKVTQRIVSFFFFFFNMTRWIEPSFLNMSQWIEPFCRLTQRIEPCFFFFNMTQILDPLQKYDFQELNLLKIWIKGLNFWKCDSKHWTLFFNRVNESNPLFQHESKKWIFFLNMTHKTQRIETSFNKWLEELNFFWRKTWPTELNHFFMWPRNRTLLSNMSHRNWTFLFFMTQRIEPFFLNMTRRINLLLGYDAKIDPFLLNFDKIKELNLLFKNGSKNWTFF